MCKFFSFVGDGYGNYLFSDWNTRKTLLDSKSRDSPDSHTWILTNNKVRPTIQDRWSKYEFNPLTKKFTIDEPVEGHDHESAEVWINTLNFKNIVPQLKLKKIKNSLAGKPKKITEVQIQLLKEWASVGDSVRDSAWDSVRDSVGDFIWDSVRNSVWDSVWNSVGGLIWDSVRDSVGDSAWNSVGGLIWDSVWNSVWNSVWAYASTFIEVEYKYNFSSGIALWNSGFMPSFDGKIWRLHSGKKAEVVFEISAKELRRK